MSTNDTATQATDPQADIPTDVVDATPATEEATTPPVDVDQAAAEAFDKGIEEVSEPAQSAVTDPKDAADVTANAAPAAATPEPKPEPVAQTVDADTDKAVKDLGLRGKAEERFRQMAGTIKETEPLRGVLTKHNVKDVAQLEDLLTTAARGVEWEKAVLSSTATPDQFGSAMNVIKAMNSDDIKLQHLAFDAMLETLQAHGRKIGRELPGLVDPLDNHPDLKTAVDSGDLDRKYALEMVKQRATTEHHTQITQRQQQEAQQQAAVNQAVQDINALNDELKAVDPDFARKLPFLAPALDTIRATIHPSQWAAAVKRAYLSLPALPPVAPVATAPAQRPAVSNMPMRPTGSAARMQPKPRTDEEAFEMGVQSVSG